MSKRTISDYTKQKTCKWLWVATEAGEKVYTTECWTTSPDRGVKVPRQNDSTHCPFCGGVIKEVE